ncbi:hypothetical protein BH20ACI2_BH20ACI2_01480 [soil metagenome]
MRMITLAVLLLTVLAVSAQTRTFRWQDELCTYEGTYNASKTPLIQRRSTLDLARPGSYTLETNVVVWKFEDIARIDVKALDLEYQKKTAELRSLNVVDAPYW